MGPKDDFIIAGGNDQDIAGGNDQDVNPSLHMLFTKAIDSTAGAIASLKLV
jgi:hypothetical protein